MSHKGHAAVAKVDYGASSKILAVVVTHVQPPIEMG